MNNWMLRLLKTELGRRVQLQLLMNLVAGATSQKRRFLLGMPSEQGLKVFAQFTTQHLESSPKLQEKLYQEAYRLGSLLRKILRIKTDEQLATTVFQLYQNIHIDMQGTLPGEVCVKRCFFSAYYTPGLCKIASCMDAGVICGLAHGGTFRFTQRITQGDCQCKAKLE